MKNRTTACLVLFAVAFLPGRGLFAEPAIGAGPIKVGFSKVDVSHAGNAKGEFRRPLEAVVAVFSGSGRHTAIIAIDAGAFSVDFNWELQNQIARRTGVP